MGLASFLRGREQIDRVWITEGMCLQKVVVFSFNFRVGNHRAIIIDFKLSDFLNNKSSIYYLGRRRLICKFPFVVLKYNKRVMALVLKYKIKEKLDNLNDNQSVLEEY